MYENINTFIATEGPLSWGPQADAHLALCVSVYLVSSTFFLFSHPVFPVIVSVAHSVLLLISKQIVDFHFAVSCWFYSLLYMLLAPAV